VRVLGRDERSRIQKWLLLRGKVRSHGDFDIAMIPQHYSDLQSGQSVSTEENTVEGINLEGALVTRLFLVICNGICNTFV